ncbi:MAG: helix-turn-helix domain-containing protein, partial [Mesorhizobium sp.]|nr:helix-turn-helix domain-containing protein [Mesorhizobium sp.]
KLLILVLPHRIRSVQTGRCDPQLPEAQSCQRDGRRCCGTAARLGLSQATAYRLIKLFRAAGTILSLVDRKRGRPQGHCVLDGKREAIIRAMINAYYLKRTRPTVSQLVRNGPQHEQS